MLDTMKDNFTLRGEKLVIVTGGSGLLGKEYCRAIKQINGIAVNLDLKSGHIECDHNIICDITKEESILEALEYLKRWKIPIWGLINNAAIDPKFDTANENAPKPRLEDYSLDQWNKEMNVGLTGAFLCAKIFGKEMVKNGGGSIINISSVLGLVAPNQNLYKQPDLADNEQPVKPVTYSVIKHGIIGLTKYLATYWADKGVRCNALAPGGVYNNHPTEFYEKLIKYIPMNRMANVWEYNSAIQFLLSPASSFMTGSVLTIDGGQSCW